MKNHTFINIIHEIICHCRIIIIAECLILILIIIMIISNALSKITYQSNHGDVNMWHWLRKPHLWCIIILNNAYLQTLAIRLFYTGSRLNLVSRRRWSSWIQNLIGFVFKWRNSECHNYYAPQVKYSVVYNLYLKGWQTKYTTECDSQVLWH